MTKNSNDCICEPSVTNLSCPVHGPEWKEFMDRMHSGSTTEQLMAAIQQAQKKPRVVQNMLCAAVSNRKQRRKFKAQKHKANQTQKFNSVAEMWQWLKENPNG